MEAEILHPDELAERYLAITIANEERWRRRIAAKNRAAGRAEPHPGDRLYIRAVNGIKRRNRAGLQFEAGVRREVTVSAMDGAELLAAQRAGASVCSVHGAEDLLADDSLIVNAPDAESELGAEVVRLRAEVDRLVAEARRNAADPGDGTSGRLKAAAKARAQADGGDFGGTK